MSEIVMSTEGTYQHVTNACFKTLTFKYSVSTESPERRNPDKSDIVIYS